MEQEFSAKLSEFQNAIKRLIQSQERTTGSITDLNKRIIALERRDESQERSMPDVGHNHVAAQQPCDIPLQDGDSPAPSPGWAVGPNATGPSSEWQSEFGIIKDSVRSVRLPADLWIPDSKQGIKRDDQQMSNVVNKSAKFAETTLRLLWNIQSDSPVPTKTLLDLYTVQVAQIKYLQEEHAALLV